MFCPFCGTAALADARFCHGCGGPLAGIVPQAPAAGPASNGNPKAAAERRLITLMFCDMVGSSALTASMDPEDFANLLVAYREACAQAISRFGGYVSRYVGDGILACFGYPRAHGRDAEAAVACGLELTADIGRLAGRMGPLWAGRLSVRIGIETGIVVAGRLGPGAAMELDALVGAAPNVAARLQAVAAPDTVVIGVATHGLVGSYFRCIPLPASPQLPVPGWHVTSALGRREALSLRRASALAGRDAEIALLLDRWERAADGDGQVALVSGEPGIGKSRLARELFMRLGDRPHSEIEMICSPRTAQSPLWPALEALRDELGLSLGSDPAVWDARLSEFVASLKLPFQPYVAVLLAALHGSDPGEEQDLSPNERRRCLLELLTTWVLARAVGRPLLILVEDIHWADPSLLDLLQRLADSLTGVRILLIATYRSDFGLGWPDRPNTLRVALRRLSRQEAERLLEQLGAGPLGPDTDTRAAILARAEGVPLFIEEFVLATAQANLPQSLQQLFAARLDALGEAKELAQLAAVLGRECARGALATLANLPPAVLDERLRRLVHADILVPRGAPPNENYAFRHALLQESAYESLLLAERRLHHRRVAQILANANPGLAATQPEILAHHHALGEEPDAAVRLLVAAARRFYTSSAHREAEAVLRRARDLAQRLTGSASIETTLEIDVLLGNTLMATHGYASAHVGEVFERARTASERLADPVRAIPVLTGLAGFYQVRGPLSTALNLAKRLRAMAATGADTRILADARRRHGWSLCCMGQLGEGMAELENAVCVAERAPGPPGLLIADTDPRAIGIANLAWFDLLTNGPEASAARARQAVAAARSVGSSVTICYALQFAAYALQKTGHFAEARALAEEVQAVATDKGIAYWIAMSAVSMGFDDVRAHQDPVGLARLEEGVSAYARTEAELLLPIVLSQLGEALLLLGHAERAAKTAADAIRVADRIEAHGFVPSLRMLHAGALARAGVPVALVAAELALAAREASEQGASYLAAQATSAMRELAANAA